MQHWAYDAFFYHIYPLGCPAHRRAMILLRPAPRGWNNSTAGSITCLSWASTHCIWDRSLNPARTATIPPIIIASIGGWANADTLNSVTNYECYKGLYSSLLDKNYFEMLIVPLTGAHQLVDVLNGGEVWEVRRGMARIDRVWPHWARILTVSD
jgi:hypothetical protein